MGFGSFMQAAAGAPPLIPDKQPAPKRSSKDVKESGSQKKRRSGVPAESKGGSSRVGFLQSRL